MNKQKKIIKKPNGLIYFFAYIIIKLFLRLKCKASFDTKCLRTIREPALILCPHISNMDFLLVAAALYPIRPSFVVSEHFLARPRLRWILTKMHVIPKKMFCPDVRTIINIMRAKESGNTIVLFPEGRLPAIGHSVRITDGTADLVKKLKTDVYTITGNGAYKTLPKWGRAGFRSGKIEVRADKLLDAASIEKMSIEEVEKIIENSLVHDEDKLFTDVSYKCSRPALGLDGVLYKCPACLEEFKMLTDDCHIRCRACGFDAELDNRYRLHGAPFETINQWYFWQVDKTDINQPLYSETIVAAADENGNLNRNAGRGTVRMDSQTISYNGTLFGRKLEFSEDISNIKALPISVGDHFDIYHKKKMYNFILQPDPRAAIKWSLYMDKVTDCKK